MSEKVLVRDVMDALLKKLEFDLMPTNHKIRSYKISQGGYKATIKGYGWELKLSINGQCSIYEHGKNYITDPQVTWDLWVGYATPCRLEDGKLHFRPDNLLAEFAEILRDD